MEKVSDVKSVIHAGIKISLSMKSGTGAQQMQSSVVVVGHDGIGIEIPVKDGYYHPLQKGTAVEISFFADTGQYWFECEVKGRIIYDQTPIMILSVPSVLMRTERREYYRVDTLFPVKIIITELVGEGNAERVVSTEYKAHCVDISGGGMQLDLISEDIPMTPDMVVQVDFCEALEGVSRVKGVAVRPPCGTNGRWGIKFTKVLSSDRDKIVRYVFQKQRDAKSGSKQIGG